MDLLFLLFVAELNSNLFFYELDSKAITRNSETKFFSSGKSRKRKEKERGKKERDRYLRNINNNFLSGILIIQISRCYTASEFI